MTKLSRNFPALIDPASYRSWQEEKLRSMDRDEQRHINNNVLAMFCEEGRRAFLRQTVMPHLAPGDMVMVAAYTIEFLSEMHYPGVVRIGTALRRCGSSSIVLAHAQFTGETCHVVCEATVVFVDPQTRKGKPLPQAARDALMEHLIAEG